MKKKEINYQLLIRRICLIVLDIICIIAASILALLTRFEFDFSQIPKEFLKVIYKYGPFTIVITLIIFSLFRIYSSLWEYARIEEVFSLIAACLVAAVAKIVIILFTWSVMPRSWYVLDTIYLMILIGATRVSYRLIRLRRQNRTFPWSKRKKVMIIGGGEAGRSLITEIQNSKYLDQKVVCIIDDDPYKIGRYIKGVKVVGNRNSIKKSVKKYNVQQIILTIPSANAAKIRPIVEICQDTNCEFMILPGVYQLVNGEVRASKLRPVNIDDLLGRDEVYVNLDEVMDYVSGRVIMVTGGGGSIGSELCRQIAKHSPKQLIIFDIYENNAYDIQQELLREQPKLDLVVLIGSVRDENRINSIFEQYRPEIIYHAAAHKHVPLMEGSPNEAIKNNVLGTYNMVRMADKWNVKRFVQISTDKAVNPTNIMGASKRICEMIIQTYNKESNTEYVAVRFGNVLGSNGSVIPLFKKQIAEGGPVTVTHPEIIRYFMTIPEAVSLVLQAGAYAKGGEIFVLDMGEPVKILDLAFRTGQAKRPDDEVIHYQVEMTENLDEIKEDLLGKKTGRVIYRDNLTVFQTLGGECRFINFLGMDWHYAVSSQEGMNQYHVWFVPEVAEMLDQDTVYLAAFSLEKQAIRDHAMILHSAYMCYEDTAVLFSAPSETGKSTQAGLWEKYRGTWTVNGDRSLLIREEDGWYANGWPVCGSSEICNNKSYPVRAIVMLSQAKENRISRLKGLEALRKVMEQITINAWNSEFQIQAMDELEILLKEVPVYHLECDISEDAVRCLEDVLSGGRGEE